MRRILASFPLSLLTSFMVTHLAHAGWDLTSLFGQSTTQLWLCPRTETHLRKINTACCLALGNSCSRLLPTTALERGICSRYQGQSIRRLRGLRNFCPWPGCDALRFLKVNPTLCHISSYWEDEVNITNEFYELDILCKNTEGRMSESVNNLSTFFFSIKPDPFWFFFYRILFPAH